MTKHTMKCNLNLVGAAVTGVLLIGGCATDNSDVNTFFPSSEERSIHQFAQAQAASGARADATLQPAHFDGGALNSLGEAKLDLMLDDDDQAEPVVVYINMQANDANLKARRDAVIAYLEDHGVDKNDIEFKLGSNPNNTSLAVQHLARLPRTESTGDSGDDTTSSSSGGSSTGGSTSSGGTQ